MSGFFSVVSSSDCVEDVFYGTDYHSYPGTKRAGMVFFRMVRAIFELPDRQFTLTE
jgi:hypothetical protein